MMQENLFLNLLKYFNDFLMNWPCFLFIEIVLRKKKNQIHRDTLILCVVDPKPNIGSGGATLNAILHVTEHISAVQGYTVSSG